MILAFVRMGGESRPWGVALGPPDQEPKIWTVGEARDRELVGGMLESVAPVLLAHMGHPDYARARGEPALPHIWLPNASHVEMLHFLAFTYTYAKRGEPSRMRTLNALGRAANWLFQESTRPGQMSCLDASRALRDAFTFPAEDVRQAHTGYLLAWLETQGSLDARVHAAAGAEQHAVSTSLDPHIEKDGLDEDVEAFNAAKRDGNAAKMKTLASKIEKALAPELRHRFEVAARAYRRLHADPRPVNPGVHALEAAARDRYEAYLETERKAARSEKVRFNSPETDGHSLMAASNYVTFESAHGEYVNALVHDDEDMQEDLLLAGDGVRGKIVAIEFPSEGRLKRATWIVEEDVRRPLRLRDGAEVTQAGCPKRVAKLREIDERARGPRRFRLDIVKGVLDDAGPLGRNARDGKWKGQTVTFLSLPKPEFGVRRRMMLWDQQGPGIWLTHRQPWEDAAAAAGEDDLDVDAGAA
ncbi:MAG: hypothetical protein U1F45_02570 [Burkholderiales bacterium]